MGIKCDSVIMSDLFALEPFEDGISRHQLLEQNGTHLGEYLKIANHIIGDMNGIAIEVGQGKRYTVYERIQKFSSRPSDLFATHWSYAIFLLCGPDTFRVFYWFKLDKLHQAIDYYGGTITNQQQEAAVDVTGADTA